MPIVDFMTSMQLADKDFPGLSQMLRKTANLEFFRSFQIIYKENLAPQTTSCRFLSFANEKCAVYAVPYWKKARARP